MLSPNLSAASSFDDDSNVTPLTDTAPALVGSFVLTPAIFSSKETVDDVLAAIRKEADKFIEVRDISTAAGRAAIASFAHSKIAKSKTALDELGKTVKDEAQQKVFTVDAERRRIREYLDDLRDEVRKPLTDWEERERSRCAEHEERLRDIDRLALFHGVFVNSAIVRERLVELDMIACENFQEFSERAARNIVAARALLQARLALEESEEAERAEAEHAELERLQREQQEREERIAREAREEAERKQRDAEERQAAAEAAQREIAERIERDRVAGHEGAIALIHAAKTADPANTSGFLSERLDGLTCFVRNREWQEFTDAALEAYESARTSLEGKITAAQQREERDRQDREAAIATRARLDEQQRQEAAAAAEEEAQAKRETNKRIRNRVKRQIVEALDRIIRAHMGENYIPPTASEAIAIALIDGKVPNVTVTF